MLCETGPGFFRHTLFSIFNIIVRRTISKQNIRFIVGQIHALLCFQPSSFSYDVKEGETLLINFTVTVPVGCFDEDSLSHCKASIFILTPTYRSSASSCQNFSDQGEVSFDEKNCGILIESSTWWEENVLKVTGKTDGLINVRDRDVFIRLGTTKTAVDFSGVWNNFTMPDIRVCALFALLFFIQYNIFYHGQGT